MTVKQVGLEVLEDISAHTGKDRRWRERKLENELLSMAYKDVDIRKAERLTACSQLLTFRQYDSGEKQLHHMQSCCVRLCPICTWRRSLKIFYQTKQIVDYLSEQNNDFCYLLLTLTVRNVPNTALHGSIQALLGGWRSLCRAKPFQAAVKGWYRSIEITHDVNPKITLRMYQQRKKYYDGMFLSVGNENPNYDTYHPHIHALLAVDKSYFKSRNYIKNTEWMDLWKRAMKLEYDPNIDIRTCKGETMEEINKAVAEASKYAAKSSDYILPQDWDLTVNTVSTLDAALHKVRLIAYGGVLRDAHQALKLDDVEKADADLVDVGETVSRGDEFELVNYWWYTGYRQYFRV